MLTNFRLDLQLRNLYNCIDTLKKIFQKEIAAAIWQ